MIDLLEESTESLIKARKNVDSLFGVFVLFDIWGDFNVMMPDLERAIKVRSSFLDAGKHNRPIYERVLITTSNRYAMGNTTMRLRRSSGNSNMSARSPSQILRMTSKRYVRHPLQSRPHASVLSPFSPSLARYSAPSSYSANHIHCRMLRRRSPWMVQCTSSQVT